MTSDRSTVDALRNDIKRLQSAQGNSQQQQGGGGNGKGGGREESSGLGNSFDINSLNPIIAAMMTRYHEKFKGSVAIGKIKEHSQGGVVGRDLPKLNAHSTCVGSTC